MGAEMIKGNVEDLLELKAELTVRPPVGATQTLPTPPASVLNDLVKANAALEAEVKRLTLAMEEAELRAHQERRQRDAAEDEVARLRGTVVTLQDKGPMEYLRADNARLRRALGEQHPSSDMNC